MGDKKINRVKVPVPGQKDESVLITPGATNPAVKHILFLQRSIGNLAVSRLIRMWGDMETDHGERIHVQTISQPALQRQEKEVEDPGTNLLDPENVEKLKKYKEKLEKLKAGKKRELFIMIYNEVLNINPFSSIEVGKIQPVTTKEETEEGTIIRKTLANAETKWIDPLEHSKGIKVTFNEMLFDDTLEEIVSTALHEAVHALQLKGGVPYTERGRGREIRAQEAVTALSELDAYMTEIDSPFFKILPEGRRNDLLKYVEEAEKDAIEKLSKIKDPAIIYKGYHKQIENIIPRFKGIEKRKWFMIHPLPWKAG